MTKFTLNDNDRAQWVDNDECLYLWRRATRQSVREFVRAHRADIDAHIRAVIG